jgi:predicted DNA-binding transcriptional regulator AlpA
MAVVTKLPAASEEICAAADPFLTKAQVLQLLPICATSLWSIVRRGELPPPQILGNRPVWRTSVIENYMRTRAVRLYKGMKP